MADPRFQRQVLPGLLSERDQAQLRSSVVVVAGAGGLGSPVATYLVAAGVGDIRIIDRDVVEESNLNRQFMHSATELGCMKAESAARFLAPRSLGDVVALPGSVTEVAPASLLSAVDLVVDCLDNYEARDALARSCTDAGTPLVWGAVGQVEGYVSAWNQVGARFCDVFPRTLPNAWNTPASLGILGATCGIVGSVMAMTAIAILLGRSSPLVGRLWRFDGGTMRSELLELG